MVFLRVNNEEAIKQTWSVVLTANDTLSSCSRAVAWRAEGPAKAGDRDFGDGPGRRSSEAWWTPSPVSGLPGSELLQCVI